MDKTSKACQIFVCIILSLATLFHGGFFSVEYIVIAISFFFFLAFSRYIHISVFGSSMMVGVVLLYCLSSIFGGYNIGNGIVESVKPIILLGAIIVGTKVEKPVFAKALVIASSGMGVIGLLSLCRVIEFNDFVYVYDGVKSLQSTMQYANSAAIVLMCGIFSSRAMRDCSGHSLVYTISEIFLTVCLLFTHSRIAVAVYILLVLAELVMMKRGLPLDFLLRTAGAVAVYLLVQYLINIKLSFMALILCVVAILFVSERICNGKKIDIKFNRLTAIIAIVAVCCAIGIALCFVDVSTIMIRILYYLDGIKALIANPLWGLSPGGWGEYQYNYQSAQYFVKQVHNSILQVGLDAGVVAMILFAGLLVAAWIGMVKIWRRDKTTDDMYVLFIFSALILHGIFDFDFSYGNILIILGICIAYGMPKVREFKVNAVYRAVAGLCVVALVGLGTCETMFSIAQSAFNQGDYQKASVCYEFVSKMRPCDFESEIMRSLCLANSGDMDGAEEIANSVCRSRPDNREIILKAMDMVAKSQNFSMYMEYQNQLMECAPMQQDTYSNAARYLDSFCQNGVIDDELCREEKRKLLLSAVEANERMSRFNKYLHFGAEINIDVLK